MPKRKPSLRIRKTREKLHLSQEEFASRLGVSRRTVSRWETERNIPHSIFLERLKGMSFEVPVNE